MVLLRRGRLSGPIEGPESAPFRCHSFLIQPTTSLRCLNLRMAMAPGVSDWNWSIRDNERWRLPDADV